MSIWKCPVGNSVEGIVGIESQVHQAFFPISSTLQGIMHVFEMLGWWMDMSYPLQLDVTPRDPRWRKKMEKTQLGNKLWLPVPCLTSWLTLEAGVCGPHKVDIQPFWVLNHHPILVDGTLTVSSNSWFFSMLLLFHVSQRDQLFA